MGHKPGVWKARVCDVRFELHVACKTTATLLTAMILADA